jgi:16S rRNA processing protein RimM
VNDRNEAEKLKGTILCAPESDLPEKPEDTWYYRELIGLDAMLGNGQKYGKIIAVHNFGAGDIIDIEKIDGSTEMLPFNEVFVGDVDMEKGTVIVFPPEYVEAQK